MQTKQWFIDNIGKRIYRDKSNCKCIDCRDSEDNWFIIIDKTHAWYLYDIEQSYAIQWVFLNYRLQKYE